MGREQKLEKMLSGYAPVSRQFEQHLPQVTKFLRENNVTFSLDNAPGLTAGGMQKALIGLVDRGGMMVDAMIADNLQEQLERLQKAGKSYKNKLTFSFDLQQRKAQLKVRLSYKPTPRPKPGPFSQLLNEAKKPV